MRRGQRFRQQLPIRVFFYAASLEWALEISSARPVPELETMQSQQKRDDQRPFFVLLMHYIIPGEILNLLKRTKRENPGKNVNSLLKCAITTSAVNARREFRQVLYFPDARSLFLLMRIDDADDVATSKKKQQEKIPTMPHFTDKCTRRSENGGLLLQHAAAATVRLHSKSISIYLYRSRPRLKLLLLRFL